MTINLQKQAQFIRNRWHPLWRLRKSRIYRYIQKNIDFIIFINMPKTKDKVAIKFLRDFSWLSNSANNEPEIVSAFKLVLNTMQPKTFWDIGSNIGFYSWFVRQYPSIKNIVLFEPDPTNYALIQKTILKNNILICEAINIAVSDKTGEANFVIDEASGATGSLEATSETNNRHSLHSHYSMGDKTIKCYTSTIDDLTQTRAYPDFIKIDVEGAEHLVILGGIDFINKHKPTMIIESTDKNLIRRLKNKGYTVFQIDSENFLFISNEHIGAIEVIGKSIVRYTD